jgi:hypothetical protein
MDETFKSAWLDYILIRKNTKNIRIRVTGASEVIVSAPRRTAQSTIDGFIRENIDRINSNLEKINSKRLCYYPAKYIDGETFWHLGYKTKLKIAASGRARTQYAEGTLTLYVPEEYSKLQKKTLFMRWSKKMAHKFFMKIAISPFCAKKTAFSLSKTRFFQFCLVFFLNWFFHPKTLPSSSTQTCPADSFMIFIASSS